MMLGRPFILMAGITGDISTGHAAPLWTAVIALVGFGFFKGIYDANIWASMYDVVTPSRRGTALGIANMLGWLGAGISAPVIGYAVDYGIPMSTAISYTSIMYVLVGLVLLEAGLVFAPRDIRHADSPEDTRASLTDVPWMPAYGFAGRAGRRRTHQVRPPRAGETVCHRLK